MNKINMHVIWGLILWLTFLAAVTCFAQPASMPCHTEVHIVNSGVQDGQMEKHVVAFREVIRVPQAPWLRLNFGKCNLGQESYLLITSLEDGAWQRLNSISLIQWQSASAFFNGDALEVELHVASGDKGIFFEVREIMVGEHESNNWIEGSKDICDIIDDRVPSEDDAIGRFIWIVGADSASKCTGWITSSGAYLTAGHCAGMIDVLEFNIPPSDSNGTTNFAHPHDQYAVIPGSIDFHDNGLGDDWTVFNVSPNSNTGLLPPQAQGAFYRMSRDSNPGNIRITGYGVDDDPLGTTGGYNLFNRTQQTHAGPNEGETVDGPADSYWEYRVDTMTGNSGGPVISFGSTLTLGIHTHGGCGPAGFGANAGTSFENDSLEAAIQTFPGDSVVYVDKGHTVIQEDGTVFRPWDTVAEGVIDVLEGGKLSIVKGSYDEPMEINKAMTIVAPVGAVTIGEW